MIQNVKENCIQEVLEDLSLFTKLFYKERTGREFTLSNPLGRESHFLTIFKALRKVIEGKTKRLIINIPPRYGKSEILIHFVAWSLAIFPDSNYLYVSCSLSLAKKQTQTIRDIINLSLYKKLSLITIKDDVSAKDNFEVNYGGTVFAAGAGGTIIGRGAGILGAKRFGGCIVIDDIHKPDEVTSDTSRQRIKDWYYNTLQSRVNSPDTPIIFIGQRLHEDDLAATLLKTDEWETVILPDIDEAGNALYPEKYNLQMLHKMKKEEPYVFAAQRQQDPLPSGGALFQNTDFILHDFEPEILSTFITVDTAETDKTYNDATVFSFFGVYRIKQYDAVTDYYGLHWLDCIELRIEPKDLEIEFINFYRSCMHHKVKPHAAVIERKSTGVTLASVLKDIQGLQIIDIPRTKASGSKTTRYIEIQPYIAKKFITLPTSGKHTKMCIEHMSKITANDSHRFDDICDTLYDAIKLALIDKTILYKISAKGIDDKAQAKNIMSFARNVDRLKKQAHKI